MLNVVDVSSSFIVTAVDSDGFPVVVDKVLLLTVVRFIVILGIASVVIAFMVVVT